MRSVDPVIRYEVCRNLAQNAVTQPVHDSTNILIVYKGSVTALQTQKSFQNCQRHATMHLLRSYPKDMTSDMMSSKQGCEATRPRSHECTRQKTEISESKNPLYNLSEVSRRENIIHGTILMSFHFGFCEILQAVRLDSLSKPSTLRRPYISWSLHLRQIQYSYSVNSHDSSNQLLISERRIF